MNGFIKKTRRLFSRPVFLAHTSFDKGSRFNNEGQISIVIILLIAIGLIFYAVSLNIGRISQTKMITVIASNIGAAKLASYMASYGEQVFQESLGGKQKVCGFTGAFKALMLIIIFIAIIVLAPLLGPAGAQLLSAAQVVTLQTGAAIAAAFATVSLVIQAAVIEPMITDLWNEMIWENLSITDAFMEQGLGTALRQAVTDQVQIPDILDIDADGIFGLTNDADPDSARDKVGRFAYYYLWRVKQAPPPPDLRQFSYCLCTMLYVDDKICLGFDDYSAPPDCLATDFTTATPEFPVEAQNCLSPDWGFYDPLPCGVWNGSWNGAANQPCCPTSSGRINSLTFPAMCDPCCQPQWTPSNDSDGKTRFLCEDGLGVADPNDCFAGPDGDLSLVEDNSAPVPLAPECCYDGTCGNPSTCYARSPYRNEAGAASNAGLGNYPYIFDPHYENTKDNVPVAVCPAFISFREQLGRDDENINYNVIAANPNWHDAVYDSGPPVRSNCSDDLGQCWYEDPPEGPGATFYIKDASGFYRPDTLDLDRTPVYDPLATIVDEKRGVFPFFYKMRDWGINLMSLDFSQSNEWLDYHCYWCDITVPDPIAGNPEIGRCTGVDDNIEELDNNRLNLPIDPATTPLSGSWCIYRPGENTVTSFIKADNIPEVSSLLFAQSGTCAAQRQSWREGFDAFCDPIYPYEQGCAKNLGYQNCQSNLPLLPQVPMDCICAEPGAPASTEICAVAGASAGQCTSLAGHANLFPDDMLDQLMIDIHDFYDWAELFADSSPLKLGSKLRDWYDEAADWIEPGCARECWESPPASGNIVCEANGYCDKVGDDEGCIDAICCHPPDNTACPGSFTNKQRTGKLWEWRSYLDTYHSIVHQWLNTSYANPDAGGPNVDAYAWCIPDVTNVIPGDLLPLACTPLDEQTIFNDGDGDLVFGDVHDILACLKWNAGFQPNSQGLVPDPLLHPFTGQPVMVSPPPHIGGGVPIEVVGNALKFRACYEACTNPLGPRDFFICDVAYLPRSLDSTLCPPNFIPPFNGIQAGPWDTCLSALRPTAVAAVYGPIPPWWAPAPPPPPYPALPVPPFGNPDATTIYNCGSTCGPLGFYNYPGFFSAPTDWIQPTFNEVVPVPCAPGTYISCALLGGVPPLESSGSWCEDCVAGVCNARQVQDVTGLLTALTTGSCDNDAFFNQVALTMSLFGYADNTAVPGLNSCTDANYLTALQNSEQQAYNQVEKYRYRAWFLDNRVREADNVDKTFGDAIYQLTRFLDAGTPYDKFGADGFGMPGDLGPNQTYDYGLSGPLLGGGGPGDDFGPDGIDDPFDDPSWTPDDWVDAPAEYLVYQRKHLDRDSNTRLSSVVVYVWQDALLPHPRADGITYNGYKHAVKVEARLPQRCNFACGTDQWPYVKTVSHTFKRCFYLDATRGMVKVRVIRFDEEKDSAQMQFPDSTPIWQTRFFHPTAGPSNPADYSGIFSFCVDQIDEILRFSYPVWGDPTAGISPLGYAFMLNKVPESPGAPVTAYDQCWSRVHTTMLEYGVTTETCAEYYFAGGSAQFGMKGFKLKFSPCDKLFLQGLN